MTQTNIKELSDHIRLNGYDDGVDMLILDMQESVYCPEGEIITARLHSTNKLMVGGLVDEDNSFLIGIEELPDYVQNAVFCTAMNTRQDRHLVTSAETKLMGYLSNRNVANKLVSSNNGDGLYFCEIGNRLAIVRRDKEEDTDLDSVGIRLIIYPDWDILHGNQKFFEVLSQSLYAAKDYEAMGKLSAWKANGQVELRPRPVDIYYTDIDQALQGCDYEYFEDEYEPATIIFDEVQSKQEPAVAPKPIVPLSHLNICESYKVMINAAKCDLVNKICEAYENGMNIPHDLPIGVTSMEGEGGNINMCESVDGVTITENDEQTEMQLSFVAGWGSELPPAYSQEWNLKELPLETLIYIYINMKK